MHRESPPPCPVSRPLPSVLVADDDPVSLAFLTDALRRLGCAPTAAAGGAEALREASSASFDLLLLDCRMPDLGGAALLAALREHGVAAPAMATSAELDPATNARLLDRGFVAVLEKPLTFAELERALRPYLPSSGGADAPMATPPTPALLDDASALAALGGSRDALRGLRQLLAGELRTLREQLDGDAARREPHQLGERLHRLRASCGFCGANALAAAAAALQRALEANVDDPAPLVAALRAATEATLAALETD